MPTQREIPAPSPPELFHRGGSGRGTLTVAVVAASLMFVGFIYAMITLDRVERERNAFLAKCIEFNTEDRCYTIWRYGRRDLMMERPQA